MEDKGNNTSPMKESLSKMKRTMFGVQLCAKQV